MKIGQGFNCPSEIEGGWKPKHPLKGPEHRLSHFQALALGSGERRAAREVPKIYKERLSCVTSVRGLEGQLLFSLC